MTTQLTAAEVRQWREQLSMSQEGFARFLDLSRATIARIELGQVPAPGWMALARAGSLPRPAAVEDALRKLIREIVLEVVDSRPEQRG